MWDEMVNGLYIETQESSRPLIHYQPQQSQLALQHESSNQYEQQLLVVQGDSENP